MANSSSPLNEARPLLSFGQPVVGAIPTKPDFKPQFRPIKKPNSTRQGERLTPQFKELLAALEGERAQLAESTTASDPELVAVFDLAGTVDAFLNACRLVDGLEFLSDLQEDSVSADDDFYLVDNMGDAEENAPQSLYMVMSNAQAVNDVVRLFELWVKNPKEKFATGLNPLKSVFALLRGVRRWGPEDRVRETGLLESWSETVQVVGQSSPSRVEIEVWYRDDPVKRARAQDEIQRLVNSVGGSVVQVSQLESIRYHALLVDIPLGAVKTVLEHGAGSIDLLTSESVMFVSPCKPMALSLGEGTDLIPAPVPTGTIDKRLPRVALLDGLPLANHVLLSGRLAIDDPDDRSSEYLSGRPAHGTAMASIILHGDLGASEPSLTRRIYVRPILSPHTIWTHTEIVPADVLLVDLIQRSFHRMFEGDGNDAAAAPGVRIVNLSIGDPARVFVRRLSPLAKLLDWLSHKYNVLIVVSAGNHGGSLSPSVSTSQLDDPDAAKNAATRSMFGGMRNRRLLSPAESVNAVTVGSLHADSSVVVLPDTVVDVIEEGSLAPFSGTGFGFRKSVKPDVLLPGGREVYVKPVADDAPLQRARAEASGPGIRVAAPGAAGSLNSTLFTTGTSNSAALATRSLDQIFEILETQRSGRDLFEFPDAQYHPVLAKALLVHAARWGEIGKSLASRLELEPNKVRREVTRLLGYGSVDTNHLASAERTRAVLIGAGSISKDKRCSFRLPIPPAIVANTEWRRMTITLAWLTPVNTRSQKHVVARLGVRAPGSLGVFNLEYDHNAKKHGTTIHHILEGKDAIGFLEGDHVAIDVDCRVDAGKLETPVRFGLAVSLEMATTIQADLYDQIAQGLRILVKQQVLSGVVTQSVPVTEEGKLF
jgi:hypothetical protein